MADGIRPPVRVERTGDRVVAALELVECPEKSERMTCFVERRKR
jgi:hypothetical protein